MKKKLDFFREFLEYVLLFFIIIECNSLYNNNFINHRSDGHLMMGLAIVLAMSILTCYWLTEHTLREEIKKFLPVVAVLELYSGIFFFFNVLRMHKINQILGFSALFFVLLPLVAMIFFCKRKLRQPYHLFYKYAEIIRAIAIINLIVYAAIQLQAAGVMSDLVKTRWSNLGRIVTFCNFYNICNISTSNVRMVHGIGIFRNMGFYTEPLMFCIPLISALFIEMYLKTKTGWNVLTWLLLSSVVFTSQATLGIMLVVVAWGIKGMQLCPKKYRKYMILPMAAVASILLLYLFRQKMEISGSSNVSSLAVHIEDFKLGLQAFLKKPVFGGGYNNEDYIRTFMSEDRLAHNQGLSNSIAIILGEGGLVWGLFCMLPFFLCFAQIFNKNVIYRKCALWAVGVFGLYTLTVFHFRLFLIFLFAFGYSLIEVDAKKRKKWSVQIFPSEIEEEALSEAASQECKQQVSPIKYGLIFFAVMMGAIWLIAGGAKIWDFLYCFMKKNQLFLGQSIWKPICMNLIFLFLYTYVKEVVLKTEDNAERDFCETKFFASIALIVVVCASLVCYPYVYSEIHTFLMYIHRWSDVGEAILSTLPLLGVCFALWVFWIYRKNRSMYKKLLFVSLSIVLCVGATIGFLHKKYKAEVDLLEADYIVIQDILTIEDGKLYVEELPALYHEFFPNISYSPSRGNSYAVYKNASIIAEQGEDLNELFENGYQMTEFPSGKLLYSNHPEVIEKLSQQGYRFTRYFSSVRTIDPQQEIEDILNVGDYTATFTLCSDIKAAEKSDTICNLKVSYNYGENIAAMEEIQADRFDTNGELVMELPFSVGNVEGVEYHVLGENDDEVIVESITIRQTPKCIKIQHYNALHQAVREEYYNEDGSAYVMQDGSSIQEKSYDAIGRVTAVKYFNASGEALRIKAGYAEIRFVYDSRGLKIYESYYDEAGTSIAVPAGYYGIGYEYDKDRRIVLRRYCDEAGNPIVMQSGYAEIGYEYDEKGRQVRESYYGEDGSLVALLQGQASIEKEYDDRNNVSVIRYFDTSGNLVEIKDGYAEIHRTYNELKQVIKEEYFSSEGIRKPISAGYAIKELEYDAYGNLVLQKYYDTNEKPVIIHAGYAQIQYAYDSQKQRISEKYFAEDGKRILLQGGYSGIGYEYDQNRNVKRRIYYDADDHAVTIPSGYAQVEYEYDAQGRSIREVYCGTDGKIIKLKSGQAGIEKEYDAWNNVNVIRYLDESGKPVEISNGSAEIHRTYNVLHQLIKEEYYGIDGKKKIISSGYAAFSREYDGKGNLIVIKYYGIEDELIDLPSGYAEERRIYNEENQVVGKEYYDKEGKQVVVK